MRLTHGSLFTGIGGIDIGFERAGMETVWQVELDEFCNRVLDKRFPDVKERYTDIANVDANNMTRVDVVSGGFPCQDISFNNTKGEGIDGERSGLWWEFWRVIREVRPLYVVVENVSALTHRGLDTVLGSLAHIGYDAEWQSIQGWWVGANHRRERLFIVAYPTGLGMERVWPEGFEIPRSLAETFLPIRTCDGEWQAEPDVRRDIHGVRDRTYRLTALGNAVIPHVAQLVGMSLLDAYERTPNKEMVREIWNGYD